MLRRIREWVAPLWEPDWGDMLRAQVAEEGLDIDAEEAACRACEDDPPEREVVDVQAAAAKVTYRHNGRNKRTRYRRVNLAGRRVIAVVHQTGVVRGPQTFRARAHHITAHRAIGPEGSHYLIHPLNVRLVAANALDRAPWHAVSIEISGNFEGIEGDGWWSPETMGASELTGRQAKSLRAELWHLTREVADFGGVLEGVAPHRISGRGSNGVPNRPLCCGYAAWRVAEAWAIERGVAVPAEGFAIGGDPVPEEWRSAAWRARSGAVRVFR